MYIKHIIYKSCYKRSEKSVMRWIFCFLESFLEETNHKWGRQYRLCWLSLIKSINKEDVRVGVITSDLGNKQEEIVGGLFPGDLGRKVIFHISGNMREGSDQKRESNTKRQEIHQ